MSELHQQEVSDSDFQKLTETTASAGEIEAGINGGTLKDVEDNDTNQEQDNGEEGTEEDGSNMPTNEMDAELERMKQQLRQMEQATLGQMPETGDQPATAVDSVEAKVSGDQNDNSVADASSLKDDAGDMSGGQNMMTPEQALADADARSIYVGNVDYKATSDELNAYFSDCGEINRITIMCNKVTGQPKGFAYVEFQDHNAVQNAIILNESMFKGRQLKITPKRTNIPGMGRGGYRGRPRYNRGGRGFYPHGRRPRRSARGRWVPY